MRFDIWVSEREQATVDETGLKVLKKEFVDPKGETRYVLNMWKPKAQKPYVHGYFRSWQMREDKIRDDILNFRDYQSYKVEQRAVLKARDDEEEKEGNNKHKSLKLIAKEVREQLKTEFPKCKFGVRTEYYSMGQALNIQLVKADFQVFRTPEELRSDAIHGEEQWQTNARENRIIDAERGYTQLGGTNHLDDRDKVFTETAKNVLNRVVDIINRDNWDNSDMQTDYYDVNYAVRFNIGSFEKPVEILGG